MSRLPNLLHPQTPSRRILVLACGLAAIVALVPSIQLAPAGAADEKSRDDQANAFVHRFSNGVSVELIGIGHNPSMEKPWWRPDGSPLADRPYERVTGTMNSTDSLTRELCWRWKGIGDADVQVGWMTEPHYSGAGGGIANQSNAEKKSGLTGVAFSLAGAPETCAVRLWLSVPDSPWVTRVDAAAGHPSSTARRLADGQGASVSFATPHADGTDTFVAVSFKIPGEVRLLAVDETGKHHVGSSHSGTGAGGFTLREFRFADLHPDQIKTWQLQTRNREKETVEFRNVSLHPGKHTNVTVVASAGSSGDSKDSNSASGLTSEEAQTRLREIRVQQREAARREFDARLVEFKGGRSPVNVLLQAHQRLMRSELALEDRDRHDILRKALQQAAAIESAATANVENGTGTIQEVSQAEYQRLEIEAQLQSNSAPDSERDGELLFDGVELGMQADRLEREVRFIQPRVRLLDRKPR